MSQATFFKNVLQLLRLNFGGRKLLFTLSSINFVYREKKPFKPCQPERSLPSSQPPGRLPKWSSRSPKALGLLSSQPPKSSRLKSSMGSRERHRCASEGHVPGNEGGQRDPCWIGGRLAGDLAFLREIFSRYSCVPIEAALSHQQSLQH